MDDHKKLYLRNPIRLDDIPIDDLNAIVFVLEYMVSIPLGTPSKSVTNCHGSFRFGILYCSLEE